jgi:hypothetical protein
MVKLSPGITVCVPTIPPRVALYERATKSIGEAARSLPSGVPTQMVVTVDVDKRGAAATRQACLELASTEWVAFLDDDDVMDPCHLRELYLAAREHGADYLWSRFRIGFPGGRTQPGPSPLGAGTFEQWNDDQPAQTTVTTLVRTELARDAGGFTPPPTDHEIDGQRAGEDWLFTLACRDVGGVFRHVPKVTWTWNHHASNTSGLPSRW